MSARILVVDDEPDIRSLLKDILEDEGYIVDIAEHARAANEIRQSTTPDLVLLDIWMPEIVGVTLLKQWKSTASDHCPVVMMSGHGTVETAVEATRFGAYDFVEKPLSMAKLLSTVKAALSGNEKSSQQDHRGKGEEPVGTSQIVRSLKRKIHALSDSNTALFFTGANGSGRRIWASYLSELSHPGVAMQLMDRITGISHFMPLRANLYVEEIVDLDKDQQFRLCDAIQHENSDSGYRFILSSRFGYSELANNNQILSVLADFWKEAIHIPSLDEHVEDIPELLEYYVNWYSELEQLPYRHFGVAAQNLLRNHHWGGELSQLKRFVKTVLSHSDSETIELDEIRRLLLRSDRSYQSGSGNTIQVMIDLDMDLREARETFEREFLSRQLALSGNNITELAKRVGQERTNLYRKLKSLGLHNKKRS
jgi:two-component system nitrogen regulation response regulator NtrX